MKEIDELPKNYSEKLHRIIGKNVKRIRKSENLSQLQLIINAIFEYKSLKLIWPLSYYIFSGILTIITIISIFKLSTSYSNNKISTRNYFTLFTILLILLTSIFILIPFASIELIVILAIPISYLTTNYYLSSSNKWIQEITFIFLLASFIFFYIQKYFDIGTLTIF